MRLTITGIERDLKRNRRDNGLRKRLFALRTLASGRTKKSVALETGLSERTLRRWEKRYQVGGVCNLKTKKRTGRPPSSWLRGRRAAEVIWLRKKYGWGAEVLQAHLKKMFGVDASLYRITQLLKRKKLLKKVRRKKKNKHIKRVKIFTPGEHTQMDVRHVDDKDGGEKRYSYNFVDHASKWTFKRVYDSYGPSETKDFILRILAVSPFTIYRLQTDNGIEFTNRFLSSDLEHVLDRICRENNIRHVCIPPGEKELNGLVEGHHRIDKDEFFTRIGKRSVEETNKLLDGYLQFRNNIRGFKTNNWLSPNEYLWEYAKMIFFVAYFTANKTEKNTDLKQEQILEAA